MSELHAPPAPSGGRGKTEQAVMRHVEALAGGRKDPRFLIAVLLATGRMLRHAKRAPEDVLRLAPYLKARNCEGASIFVGEHAEAGAGTHLVLVDDVRPERLSDARHFSPCAVVETSLGNYQAWYRSASPMAPELALGMSRLLTGALGGDPGAVGASRLGRLCGFTNRKPQHRRPDGLYPYTRLVEAAGGDSRQVALLMPIVNRELRELPSPVFPPAPGGGGGRVELRDDPSKLEFSWCCHAVRERMPECAILASLEARAAARGKRDPGDYARRTLNAARRAVGRLNLGDDSWVV